MTDTATTAQTLYTARATVEGGREGRARSDDGVLDLTLTAPKETGGPGTGTNPEQLFALGYAACFQSALTMVAKQAGVDARASVVESAVALQKDDAGFGLGVELTARIPGVDDAKAQELVEAAHQVCPYSRATRGNITVTVTGLGA